MQERVNMEVRCMHGAMICLVLTAPCHADGLGGVLYNKLSALDRVKGRWPPRATAALDAFLSVSNSGVAKGYDGRVQQYDF